ncbi:MAG: hypothetical protein GEU82_00855 [Luteitalea sp.]|nr:hypothetical protein [Luteitalea sp.]
MADEQPDPASQATSLLKRFLNEEQDPVMVEQALARVEQLLTSGEEVSYVAVQKKPMVNVTPECVVLTSKRFILYKPRLLGGANFEDYVWRELKDAQLEEGFMGATLTLHTTTGQVLAVEYLPRAQARRLYAVAQEMEERVHEERRHRELEDRRAVAGGVVLHGGAAPTASHQPAAARTFDDPVQTLQKLKAMADADLITAAEYESKKAEILSRM